MKHIHRFHLVLTLACLGIVSCAPSAAGPKTARGTAVSNANSSVAYDYTDKRLPSQNPPKTAAGVQLTPTQCPQFVILGSDDNCYADGMDFMVNTLMKNRVNPAGSGNAATFDGTAAHMSFYCVPSPQYNTVGSDVVAIWKAAYAAGHEIGNHTMNHYQFSDSEWVGQMQDCTNFLVNTCSIPKDQIIGFRTPALAYDSAVFDAIKSQGLTYDVSVPGGCTFNGSNNYWPYTLDNGQPETCLGNTSGLHPGVWELPDDNLVMDSSGNQQTGLDWNLWVQSATTKAQFVAILKNNLNLRYNGNRAPMNFGLHSHWYGATGSAADSDASACAVNLANRQAALVEFLNYALTLPDVRVVSAKEALTWVRNPVALGSTSTTTYAISVSAGSNGTISPGTTSVAQGGSQTFTITPSTDYVVDTVSVDGVNQGSITSYTFSNVQAAHTLTATFKTKPTTTYTITVSQGANGTISPNTTSVVWGNSQTFTITPATGYAVADVTVDGASVGAVTSYTFSNVTASHTLTAAYQVQLTSSYRVVGYYHEIYDDPSTIQFDKLTQINFSFAVPTADGSLETTPSVLQSVVSQAHAKGVKVLIALGGGDADINSILTNATLRAKVITNIEALITTYNLDGVDIDWEGFDETCSSSFLALMQKLYADLHPSGKLVTAVVGSSWWENVPSSAWAYMDQLNMMSYDNDYTQDGVHSSYQFAVDNVNYWVNLGFPKEKLNLGLPFYGRKNTDWDTEIAYKDLIALSSTVANLDSYGGYNYNGIPTIQKKTQLAMDQTGGVMIWELNQDTLDGTSLLSAIHNKIAGGVTSYTITASAGTGGTISPSGSVTVASGSSQTFTISPNSGYSIATVTVDGVSQGAVNTYTLSNISATHTISATFKTNSTYYTITASAGTGGTISPSGSVTVASGSSQTFTISPSSGYSIAAVTVDGVSQGAVNTYTFSNVNATHTISATFVSSTGSSNLSQGRTATASSIASSGFAANFANDGKSGTYWCAANGNFPAWWKVDLGASHTITAVDITFTGSDKWKYKVQGSTDNSTWTTLSDKSSNSSNISNATLAISNANVRYIRIYFTAAPTGGNWAGMYECVVKGN